MSLPMHRTTCLGLSNCKICPPMALYNPCWCEAGHEKTRRSGHNCPHLFVLMMYVRSMAMKKRTGVGITGNIGPGTFLWLQKWVGKLSNKSEERLIQSQTFTKE